MFDFTLVGGVIALSGIIYLLLYTWRFVPRHRTQHPQSGFAREYITEVLVRPESAKVIHLDVGKFSQKVKQQVAIVTIFRNNTILPFNESTLIHEDDVLALQGTEEALTAITEKYKLQLTGLRALERYVTNNDEYVSIEAVVPPYSKLINKAWNDVALPERYGTNFIGILRKNFTPRTSLANNPFRAHDIVLLQGRRESVFATITSLALLPLDNTEIRLGRTTTIIGTLIILITTITLASLQIAPIALLFLGSVMALIGFNLISLRQAYESIEWPILVLLAGMITLGDALVASGAANTLASGVVAISQMTSPVAILVIILITTMMMSDFINTTAAAVIMSPIAILIATAMKVSIDPFLIIVAIGASSAFLTPVGHESNALVMQRGGYSFRDFTRMGLPLEIIIALISIPLVLYAWPL
jgi:di/tricarboxylate transporter